MHVDKIIEPTVPPVRAGSLGVSDAGLLAEIAAGLSTDSDMSALLQRFLEPIVHLAGASAGAVRVLSDAGDRLVMINSIGLPGAASGAEHAVDRHCGYCGAATASRALVWAADIDDCARRIGAGAVTVQFHPVADQARHVRAGTWPLRMVRQPHLLPSGGTRPGGIQCSSGR